MTYSCRRTSGPRGQTYRYTVQDGWNLLRVGNVFVKVPNFIEYQTEWTPMRCGIQHQAGLPPDQNCKGCPNAPL